MKTIEILNNAKSLLLYYKIALMSDNKMVKGSIAEKSITKFNNKDIKRCEKTIKDLEKMISDINLNEINNKNKPMMCDKTDIMQF